MVPGPQPEQQGAHALGVWLGQSTKMLPPKRPDGQCSRSQQKQITSAGTRKESFPPVPSTDKAYHHVHSEKRKASRAVSIIAGQALKGECGAERPRVDAWRCNPRATQQPHAPLCTRVTFIQNQNHSIVPHREIGYSSLQEKKFPPFPQVRRHRIPRVIVTLAILIFQFSHHPMERSVI